MSWSPVKGIIPCLEGHSSNSMDPYLSPSYASKKPTILTKVCTSHIYVRIICQILYRRVIIQINIDISDDTFRIYIFIMAFNLQNIFRHI